MYRKRAVLEPLKNLSCMLSKEDEEFCKSIYKGGLEVTIYLDDYIIIREYNRSKHNIISNDIMKLEKLTALFCKRTENY